MTSRFKLAAVLLVLGALAACGPSTGVGGAAGDASAATVAANQAMAQQLRLDDPQGFAGVDGIVRFRGNVAERGLEVQQVTPQGFATVSPAPTNF